jgi:hypothetical protein
MTRRDIFYFSLVLIAVVMLVAAAFALLTFNEPYASKIRSDVKLIAAPYDF